MKDTPPIPEELWKTIPPAAQAVVAAVFAEFRAQLAPQEARHKELEAQLGLNSTNFSKPLSSDPLHGKRALPRTESGKKKGG
jgi:transposase